MQKRISQYPKLTLQFTGEKYQQTTQKNYRILAEVTLVGGKGRITKSNLIHKGFFFDLFTSIYKTQKGNDYYFIYDLGYLKIAPDLFVVVQKFK